MDIFAVNWKYSTFPTQEIIFSKRRNPKTLKRFKKILLELITQIFWCSPFEFVKIKYLINDWNRNKKRVLHFRGKLVLTVDRQTNWNKCFKIKTFINTLSFCGNPLTFVELSAPPFLAGIEVFIDLNYFGYIEVGEFLAATLRLHFRRAG